MIGRKGEGQIAITGAMSRAQVHLMRAESRRDPGRHRHGHRRRPGTDGAAAGLAAPLADPHRARSASAAAARLQAGCEARPKRRSGSPPAGTPIRSARRRCRSAGVAFLPPNFMTAGWRCRNCWRISRGRAFRRVLVEGGAETARAFLDRWPGRPDRAVSGAGGDRRGRYRLADRRQLIFREGFGLVREARFGDDCYAEWAREL